jgi:hypothetical protein
MSLSWIGILVNRDAGDFPTQARRQGRLIQHSLSFLLVALKIANAVRKGLDLLLELASSGELFLQLLDSIFFLLDAVT